MITEPSLARRSGNAAGTCNITATLLPFDLRAVQRK